MREQLWILSSNKTPVLRLTYRYSPALYPFAGAIGTRSTLDNRNYGTRIYRYSIHPSNHGVILARNIPQVIRPMDAPVLDRLHYPDHRLHRRPGHALAKEFPLGNSECCKRPAKSPSELLH